MLTFHEISHAIYYSGRLWHSQKNISDSNNQKRFAKMKLGKLEAVNMYLFVLSTYEK